MPNLFRWGTNCAIACFSGLLIGSVALPAFAGTATITNTNTSTTYSSLQDAINAATAGDTIEIGSGVVNEQGVFVSTPVTIRGQGMDSTTIDGEELGSILNVASTAVGTVLEDLTIAHGRLLGPPNAGGVRVQGCTTMNMSRVRFLENTGSLGGGVMVIGSDQSTTVLYADSCEFVGNTAGGQGGALAIDLGNGADITLVNCLFRGNQANSNGGALLVSRTDNKVTTVNCTFVENVSVNTNYIIRAVSDATIVMANCVVVDSPGTSIIQGLGASITMQNTLRAPGVSLANVAASGGNIVATPIFEDAMNGDYRLASGSAGIDAGDLDAYLAAGSGTLDLEGGFRYLDDPGTTNTGVGAVGFLDMGAYEFAGATPVEPSCPGDLDGSGSVDVEDLNIILGNWGSVCQ